MSHDRGCHCGKESYEYDDCKRLDCHKHPRDGASIAKRLANPPAQKAMVREAKAASRYREMIKPKLSPGVSITEHSFSTIYPPYIIDYDASLAPRITEVAQEKLREIVETMRELAQEYDINVQFSIKDSGK